MHAKRILLAGLFGLTTATTATAAFASGHGTASAVVPATATFVAATAMQADPKLAPAARSGCVSVAASF